MRWILVILLIPLLCSAQWSNEKINTSFVDHAGACMLITLGTTAVMEGVFPEGRWNKVTGFAVGMAAGLLKEFFEDQPDQIDLAADIAGCCIGVTLTVFWDEKKIKIR